MRILIEASMFVPYQEKVVGGIERFVHLAKSCLEGEGHHIEVFAAKDSTLPCLKSSALSGQAVAATSGVMNMSVYLRELNEAARGFDRVLLNQPMWSSAFLNNDYSDLYSKSMYISHDPSGWNIGGFGGIRHAVNVRFFRSRGGKSFYLNDAFLAATSLVWVDPKRQAFIHGCSLKGINTHGTDFLSLDPYDGKLDILVAPSECTSVAEAGDFAVLICRPDPSMKRPVIAARAAKAAGVPFVFFTTSRNSSTRDVSKATATIASCAALGADIKLDQPREVLMSTLAQAKVMLISSTTEGSPIVATEAISLGVPIISTCDIPQQHTHPKLVTRVGSVKAMSATLQDFSTTSLESRVQISSDFQSRWSSKALANRLLKVMGHI